MNRVTDRIVFEGGIELLGPTGQMIITTAKEPFVISAAELSARLGIRPVLVEQGLNQGRDRHTSLLPAATERQLYDIRLTGVVRGHGEGGDILEMMKIHNVLGAVLYHAKGLIEHYARISRQFSRSLNIPNHPLANSDRVVFSYQHEPYYEFESLITAARRTYEATRHVLWKNFGTKSQTPRSFRPTLTACVNMPEALRVRLEESWANFGQRITKYRDCMQHYVPLGGFQPFAMMHRHQGDVWSMTARVPDNPECKSTTNFVYEGKIDALAYALEITEEMFQIVESIDLALVASVERNGARP